MRIAIPVDEKRRTTPHTGRAAGFLIYDVNGDSAPKARFVEHDSPHNHQEHSNVGIGNALNHGHGLGQGRGQGRGQGQGQGQGNGHHHNHGSMISKLDGVNVVIAVGMGPRLEDSFSEAGIKVFYTREADPDAIIEQYRSGAFEADSRGSVCKSGHNHQ
ncbi:MAG TPA: hypothetical protein ENH10_07840 [Bacteroidetes bacterium]|nr:dinitrogenase iron-molybdenum cofactor [bacterium BMS3Bbin04]HDO65923.1 hypothetical protein [Bacteroidota bacterium]HEX05048.1 hypothetical protein [Bacteroidota bacterium]